MTAATSPLPSGQATTLPSRSSLFPCKLCLTTLHVHSKAPERCGVTNLLGGRAVQHGVMPLNMPSLSHAWAILASLGWWRPVQHEASDAWLGASQVQYLFEDVFPALQVYFKACSSPQSLQTKPSFTPVLTRHRSLMIHRKPAAP